MRKFRLPSFLADVWRPTAMAAVMIALVTGLFTYKLGTLTSAASQTEANFINSSRSVSGIMNNPFHIYQRAGNVALTKLQKQSVFTSRLLNSIVGVASVFAIYALLKRWYTSRVSLLATALFASSSWLLHAARYASTDMSYILPIGLVLGGMWMHDGRYLRTAAVIAVFTTALLLYVPAMVWLVVPAAIWQRKFIRKTISSLSTLWQVLIVVAALIGITPLVWALATDPELIRTWLGLPEVFPEPMQYLKNIAQVPLRLVAMGSESPEMGIARLPLLDLITAVMVLLGLYVNAYKLRLDRTRLILGAAVIGTLFIALEGPVSISFLLPFVYLAAAGGVALLLQQWFTVFPRNPLARSMGIVIITGVVGVASFYHLSKYFIVWPRVPETQAAFDVQL